MTRRQSRKRRAILSGITAAVLALAPAARAHAGPASPAHAPDHIDCIAAYALVEWAGPAFLDMALERAARAVAAHGDSEFRDEAYRRMHERGARMTDATTEEEMIRETDAWMAGIHICDARYGFTPMPQLWVD